MPTISCYGLEQESRVLIPVGTKQITRLQKRGITPETFTTYGEYVTTMLEEEAKTGDTVTTKEVLTQTEEQSRTDVQKAINRVRNGAKKTFPKGSPQLKQFHVGDNFHSSTKVLLGWVNDINKGWETNKALLISKGKLIEDDFTAMNAAAELLRSTDTSQEVKKKEEVPQAYTALAAAKNAVISIADEIHTAANQEFSEEPDLLNPFRQARLLRFNTPARKKEPDETVVTPAPAQ
jgi:hypothetical protein